MEVPKISSAMLVLTHACNLACRYCFVHHEPQYMTYETAMAATQFLIKNAEDSNQIPGIVFFGGEPLLRWDEVIVPLTEWIREKYKKPFNLSITSNGTLLNKERLHFLKKNQISLLLSVDGAKITQDYNRPSRDLKSSFDKLEKVLPIIIQELPETTFRMTLISDTCEHLFKNIKFAEQQGFKNFSIVPNEFEEWSEEKRRIAEKNIKEYAGYYIESMRKSENPINFTSLDTAFKDIKKINQAIRKKQFRNGSNCEVCNKCGIGATKNAAIHPNGNIYGCQELTSNEGEESIFCIGNIYTGINKERRMQLISHYNPKLVNGDDCLNCKYNRICHGGCAANNYLISGTVNKPSKIYCWWKQFLLEEAIYIMTILGEEKNIMFQQKWEEIK